MAKKNPLKDKNARVNRQQRRNYTINAPSGQKYNVGNFRGAFDAQQEFNKDYDKRLDLSNRFNTFNPFGNRSFTVDPTTGRTIVTDTLAAPEQKALDDLRARDARFSDLANTLTGNINTSKYDLSKLGGFNPNTFDFSSDRGRIEDATYGRLTRGLEDQFNQQKQSFEEQMANEGVIPGSEGYNKRLKQLMADQNDARLQARNQAVMSGGQEQYNAFNMGMQGRQQNIDEYDKTRSAGYTDLANILSKISGPRLPNFDPVANINPSQTNVMDNSLGFRNADEQRRQFDIDTQLKRMQIAKMGSGGGGGGGELDFNTKLSQEIERMKALAGVQSELRNQYPNLYPSAPKGPSTGSQIGSVLGTIANTVIGAKANSYFGKKE